MPLVDDFGKPNFMMKSVSVSQNKKRGPGRPRTGRDPVVALRLPKEVTEDVDAYAKEEGLESRGAALRHLIEEALQKWKAL